MTLVRATALCALSALSAGCALRTYSALTYELTAIDLRDVGPVAVLDFEDPDGRGRSRPDGPGSQLSAALIARLQKMGVELLDRSSFDRVSAELRLTRSDLFDPAQAVSLGRHLGARTLILGRVDTHTAEERHIPGTVSKETGTQATPPMVEWSTKVKASARAVDVETTRILAAEDESAQGAQREEVDPRTRVSRTGTGVRRGNADLLDRTLEKVAEKLAVRFVPGETRVPVDLWVDGELPELAAGNELTELGHWAEAARHYERAQEHAAPEKRHMALWNLATARAYLDDFEAAEKAADEAYSLSPGDATLGLIARIRERKERIRNLRGN